MKVRSVYFWAVMIWLLVSSPVAKGEEGIASWYCIKCNTSGPGTKKGSTATASGIPLCDKSMTAAHKTLPMGTRVKVTNLENKRSCYVVITDRGPFKPGRIIDVTIAAAKVLGFKDKGLCKCKVERAKKQ